MTKYWGIKKKIRIAVRFWKIGMLAALLAGACLLSGCQKRSEKADSPSEETSAVVNYTCISGGTHEKKIYVILKNYHGDYWQKVIGGITDATKELDASVYLGGIDNETDISGQQALMEQAVEYGADGILLAPVNSTALTDTCKKLREKKIPLVLIDSSINSSDFSTCYMTDNMEAGEIAARNMLELLYDAGNNPAESLQVGILLSSDSSQAMVNRVSGFLDYWANFAPVEWEIEQEIFLNGGDTAKAQADVLSLLRESDSVKGIFGCNNTSSIGIAKTLQREKRTDVVMVGFDLAEETKQIIRDPDYRCVSLMQKQDQMGYLGMHVLGDLLEGKKPGQKYYDTGIVVVDSDYLMENGDS